MDFSRLVEIFDRSGAPFVSVTQSFNTTTSTGRLALNTFLSFAQVEPEVVCCALPGCLPVDGRLPVAISASASRIAFCAASQAIAPP